MNLILKIWGFTSFAAIVDWVITHGLILFFVLAFLEGPLVTAAAGVSAALGYFSIYLIIIISMLGDLSADAVCYLIGYFSGRRLILRYGHWVGLTHERIEKIEKLLHRHTAKAIVIVKLSPVIPVPGLIFIGSARVSLRKFILTSLIITFPKSFLFALLGYYSGKTYEKITGTIANSQLIILGVVVVVLSAYFLYQRAMNRLSKNIDKEIK
jgi:membrane protein DedA with SNARE-associated domain